MELGPAFWWWLLCMHLKLLSISPWCFIRQSKVNYVRKVKLKFNLNLPWRHRGGVEIRLYPFFNLLCKWSRWLTPRPGRLTPWKDPVHIVQEAGWAPRPVLTGEKILAPPGIQSPDHPTRREQLYRLSYPAHHQCVESCLLSQTSRAYGLHE